ncbi:MAG: NPCBM/NEW2 domain-containing protein [Anaerolineae bacterium]|nr:NPCBM/NEW2 domain-containing protein [Phycisphaerae bacterium]
MRRFARAGKIQKTSKLVRALHVNDVVRHGSGFIEPLEDRTLFAAKIMPLGDSITQAENGHAAYRYWLWKNLQNNGSTDVDFVGSVTGVNNGSPPASDYDQNHEGHWGWRADEINANITGWANTHRPDIVLMHLGTNDLIQGQSVSSTITDLGSIIDKLRAANPNVTVIMAQIIPNNSVSVTSLNSSISSLAGQKNTAQSRVVTADQFSGFSATNDTYDGIHPNQAGEQKMSNKWYSTMTPFLTVPPPPPPPPPGTYLSTLTPTLATNGWGPYEKDRSNGENGASDGGTITLNGTTYTKGLGVHAASELRYTLSGNYSEFRADIGIDDEVGNGGSVVFQVWDNLGNKLYDSGTMTGSTATKQIVVPVAGKQELRLITTVATNGADSDHADWAFARLITATVTGPVVNTFSGATINEGGTYTATGSFTDSTSAGPWTATVNYGDGAGAQPLTLNADKTFSLSHAYVNNGGYTVTVVVSNGTQSGNKTATVTVNNVAPTITMPPNGQVAFPATWSGNGSFTDPGVLDTFTGTVDYGDGSGAVALTLAANKTFSLSKTYAQGGTYTVTVTITDNAGGSKQATTSVTVTGGPVQTTTYVSDLTPTLANNGWGPYQKDKSNGEAGANDGLTITLNGVTYTKGLGVHAASELRYNLGGNYNQFLASIGVDDEVGAGGAVVFQVWDNLGNKLYDSGTMGGATATKSVTIDVTGKQELRLIVTDGGNGADSDHADWANARLLKNSAPAFAVNAIPGSTINEGSAYSATGSFTDPGAGPWTATVNYGDGSGTQALTVNADKTFALNHLYLDNGAYTVTVTVNNGTTQAANTGTVNATNVAPAITVAGTAASLPAFTLGGSFADPGADTWSATVDYGDGTGVKALSLNADKTFTLNNLYNYNGTYSVKVTVLDDDGGSQTTTTVVTVTGGIDQPIVALSTLNPTFASNGWGAYERDKSSGEQGQGDGQALKINGVTYAKGLGVHAASDLRYSLVGGNYTSFSTLYGVDDEEGGAGSVKFQIYLDGVLAFDSGTVRGNQAAKSITVNVTGKSELRLVVTDNGDGANSDHADWATPQLMTT